MCPSIMSLSFTPLRRGNTTLDALRRHAPYGMPLSGCWVILA